jgi:hypothetical protein
VASSRSASDRLLPSPRVCDRCHETDHSNDLGVTQSSSRGGCALCHVGYVTGNGNNVARTVIPSPSMKFSHQAHVRRQIGCGQCHGSVQRLGLATREQMPRMRGCLVCHSGDAESRGDAGAACSTCHLSDPNGTIRTHLQSGVLLPPRWMKDAEHAAGFVERHATIAANDSRFCASCHTEDDCVRCHDGRIRPREHHPNDFLSMHAILAQQDSNKCMSCHRAQSFCQTCHQRAGVTMSGPSSARAGQGRFHPSSEVFTSGARGPQHHGWEARRNLVACVSCHTERDCVVCHASKRGGGMGVDPHPAGFSARCQSAFSRNPRPCLVCHEADDAQIMGCR